MKSVTFRIFSDFPVSGAIFTMPYAGILTDDEFWPLVDTWHSITPSITAAGAYAYTLSTNKVTSKSGLSSLP